MKNNMTGKRILITAGPTWEMLDPVRFLSNRSSGLMGFELAKAAARAGAKVTLVTGPVTLPDPAGVTVIRVVSARDMYRTCLKHFPKTDIAIMTAAVSDYRPAKIANHKIKKGTDMTMRLVRNPDILATLGKRKKRTQRLVGFALESRNLLAYAKEKLERKNCDLLVANTTTALGAKSSNVTLLYRDGRRLKLLRMNKAALAIKLLHCITNS